MLKIDLQGRAVVVTGAAGGLGVPLCRALLEAGAHVTAAAYSDADAATLRQTLDNDRLTVTTLDVTDEAQVQAFFDARELWGLVNVVGGYTGGPLLHETPLADLERMFALNVRSAFLCSRGALARFEAQGSEGRVVNISSAAADRGGERHFPYASTKAAVLRLTESAAAEYAARGVTVNAVQPGMIATPANKAAMPDADQSGWVSPEQIANTIAFLLCDLASGVNGAAIRLTARG